MFVMMNLLFYALDIPIMPQYNVRVTYLCKGADNMKLLFVLPFKKALSAILSFLCFLFPMIFGGAPSPVNGGYPDCSYTVQADELTVALDSNATTGYSWTYEINGSAIFFKSNSYVADENPGGLVGAGGTEIFVFKGIGSGEVTLVMTYAQSWSPDSAVRRVTCECTVDDGVITVNRFESADITAAR